MPPKFKRCESIGCLLLTFGHLEGLSQVRTEERLGSAPLKVIIADSAVPDRAGRPKAATVASAAARNVGAARMAPAAACAAQTQVRMAVPTVLLGCRLEQSWRGSPEAARGAGRSSPLQSVFASRRLPVDLTSRMFGAGGRGRNLTGR